MSPTMQLQLLKRKLALQHKLKVYDNTPPPSDHEELAFHQVNRWTLEDELKAVEELLEEARRESIAKFKKAYTDKDMVKPLRTATAARTESSSAH